MLGEISELTLEDLFSKSIIDFQDRPAYSVVGKDSITYKEVGDRAEKLIDLFNKSGLEKGSKISILGNNMPNWPVSYFAITTSSRIAVPILPDFTAFEIVNILEHSGCKALIVSKKLQYKIPEHIFNELDLIISMDELEIIKNPEKTDYVITSSPEPSDLASIIYTSGTTGTSKGVMLSHSNIVSQEYMTNKLFGIIKEDILLSILPLSHTYECSIGMIQPFVHGAHVVYLEGAPTPSLLLPALKEVRPTIMLTVPLIVEKIFKNKIRPMFTKNFPMQVLYSFPLIRRLFHKISGKKLYNTFGGKLRFFGIGGSKLDGMVERFLADAGFPYAIGYGLTETSPLLAGAIPGKTRW
ncbi:MAG: AMP-binding protein, partial [Bacteroidales bacterium]|nr:AMP-binding protein [Bacteroidales bacterium]